MLELTHAVRARHHVQRASLHIRVHDMVEDRNRTFVFVLEIGRVLVQDLGKSAHRLFHQALALTEQLNVRTQDGLNNVQGRGIKRCLEKCTAGIVIDTHNIQLFVALITLRCRDEQRFVGCTPAIRGFFRLVKLIDGDIDGPHDVVIHCVNVRVHETTHHETTVFAVDSGRLL